jgi:hypothetical protein
MPRSTMRHCTSSPGCSPGSSRTAAPNRLLTLRLSGDAFLPQPIADRLADPLPTPRSFIDFPQLSGPSRSFIFDGELTYRLRSADPNWRLDVSDYTKKSRFVLYDNGAFVLEYVSLGELGYRGGYKDANGVLIFGWEGWSVAGS